MEVESPLSLTKQLAEEVVGFQNAKLLESEDQAKLFEQILSGDTEVVLLGESTHGTEEFYKMRAALTRHLVQHRGYRAVLIEAEWPDVFVVNQYITTNTGLCSKAKEALSFIQGSGRHMWQNYVFMELVEWMKEFNAKHNFRPEEMVYLFGIDCQQIYRSLKALYECLAEIDLNLCCEIKATLSFFGGFTSEHQYTRSTIGQIGSEQIPAILQKAMSDFQWTHFDALKKKIPTSHLLDLINIEQNLEVIMNGEEYFRKSHLEPPGSQASWNTRDQHMTLTIGRIKERLSLVTQSDPSASHIVKLVAWAHNSHIGDASATSRGGREFTRNETWNLGQMVKQSIEKSYLLGFDTYSGHVTALGTEERDKSQTYRLRPALEESMEHACHEICQEKGSDSFFLDLTRDNMSSDVSNFLSRKLLHRYVGINYCPETEMQSHYSLASLKGQYHGLIFIDVTSALRILSSDDLKPPTPSQGGPGSAVTKQGHRRLVQEYRQIMRHPIPFIRVSPQEDNLWICHFLITFNFGDYKGGEYHGRLEIPQEYPMAPPRIFFYTPSGRFETETRICVSFSDYHPELWNPSWGIESVLVGLQSFMQEDSTYSLGSISTPKKHRQELAAKSHEFNLNNPHYRNLFLNAPVPPAEEPEEGEEDRFCRYCRNSGGELVSPCKCEGGNKWVHLNCLAKWQYQAILSQSTHPSYQTGLEKHCNVCLSDFKIQKFTREQLMLNFTGAEIANLIQVGCLLIATEKSSAHNVRLVEQYPHLESQLSYWTKNMFLVYNVERHKKGDGTYEDLVEGVGISQEIPESRAKSLSSIAFAELHSLGLNYRHFIGGPVSPRMPFLLLSMKTSLFEAEDFSEVFKSVSFFQKEDLSIWSISFDNFITLFSKRSEARDTLVKALGEVRVYWGCACWGRVQLLGEIARGGWGLANCVMDSWEDPSVNWELNVKRAVTAGSNDMSAREE